MRHRKSRPASSGAKRKDRKGTSRTISQANGSGACMENQSRLCQRCREVDLDQLFIGEEHKFHRLSPGGKAVVELERRCWMSLGSAHLERFSYACKLCEFFLALRPPRINETLGIADAGPGSRLMPQSDGEDVPYFRGQLAVTSHSSFCGSNWTRGNPFCMVDPPSLGNGSSEHLVGGRVIDPNCIDYDVLQTWIQACQTSHDICSGPASIPLKLINCKSRAVEKLGEHVPYVALSYVWGKADHQSYYLDDGGLLAAELPKTIEDAISVSLALRFEYLWVDKYCINQHGPEKAIEIGRMDEIYQGAEVVIIDVAGKDPNLGLAGVGRRRNRQPQVSAGGHTSVSLFGHPINNVRSSKLASRGWTYQEAVLARRRLFFTEDQVYFECHVESHMETLKQAVIHPEIGAPSIIPSDMRLNRGKCPKFLRYLEEYSKRELTYPSDALNAFLGVLRSFETQKGLFRHYWGVPIMPFCSGSESACALEGFLRGLCWSSSESKTTRRPQFPSWSWAGWDCSGQGVIFHSPELKLKPLLSRLQVSYNDKILDWPEFWARHEPEPSTVKFYAQSPPAELHITGRVIKFHGSREASSCNHCQGFQKLRLKSTTYRSTDLVGAPLMRAYLQQLPAGMQRLTAVVLGGAKGMLDRMSTLIVNNMEEVEDQSEPNFKLVLLLLREQHDAKAASLLGTPPRFERVGLMALSWLSLQQYERSEWYLEATEQDLIVV